MNYIAKNV